MADREDWADDYWVSKPEHFELVYRLREGDPEAHQSLAVAVQEALEYAAYQRQQLSELVTANEATQRSGNPLFDLQNHINNLDIATQLGVLSHSQILYRGFSAPEALVKEDYVPGTVYRDRGFLSTTVKSTGFGGNYKLVIEAPPGTNVALMGDLGGHGLEMEVLLPRNTLLYIQGVESNIIHAKVMVSISNVVNVQFPISGSVERLRFPRSHTGWRDTAQGDSARNSMDVAESCESLLDLDNARLGRENYYQSLPFCVINAVFSIGVRYESVLRVVKRYCKEFDLRELRLYGSPPPPVTDQESLSQFLAKMDEAGLDKFTEEIFQNRQRTSPRNGLLKTEAVYRFACALRKHGVEYLQDVPRIVTSEDVEKDIRAIPGQTSGISWNYFLMLAGSEDMVKPDTMIRRFLKQVMGRPVSQDEAQALLIEASSILIIKYPSMTPRLLDNTIWKYQRTLPAARKGVPN